MTSLTFPTLETDRLILRVPSPADTPAILTFFASERSNFYRGPMDAATAWRKYSGYVGQWLMRGYSLFAVTLKDSGETIGLSGPFHPVDFPEPEMSWLITDDRYAGKGYAPEAAVAVLDYLFNTLGWKTTVSFIDPDNAPSIALAERLGARLDRDTPSEIPGCLTYRHLAGEVVA